MDIVEAARVLTQSVAARSDSGEPVDADDDSYTWLSQEIDLPNETTAVIAQLIGRAFADQVFAAELMRRGSLLAAAASAPAAALVAPAAPPPAPAVSQQSTVSHGGAALNATGDLNAAGAHIVGRDDKSGQVYELAERATVINNPVTNVAGKKVHFFLGTKITERKLFLPLGFMVRIGNKAGTVAAAHPAVAVATCTIIVVGGTAGAMALAQSPPTLATAPASFTGFWQGTVTEDGKPGYPADVAITGGPVQGTVGSVNLDTLPCTSTLTLTEARERSLTIKDDTTSGACAGGTLVLTPQGPDLRYTLTHPDGTTATGLLTPVQSFAAQAPSVAPTSTPTSAPTPTSVPTALTDCGAFGTSNNGTQTDLQEVGASCATATSVMTDELAKFSGYGVGSTVSVDGWQCTGDMTRNPPDKLGDANVLVDCAQNDAKIYWTQTQS